MGSHHTTTSCDFLGKSYNPVRERILLLLGISVPDTGLNYVNIDYLIFKILP